MALDESLIRMSFVTILIKLAMAKVMLLEDQMVDEIQAQTSRHGLHPRNSWWETISVSHIHSSGIFSVYHCYISKLVIISINLFLI